MLTDGLLAFAGKHEGPAESRVMLPRHPPILPPMDSEDLMNKQAIASHSSRRGILLILAISSIAIGATLLVSKADLAVANLPIVAGDSAGQFGGSVPGLILAADRALQAWAFHRNTVLSCVREILLSCWPVLLVMFGALLLPDWPPSGRPQRAVADDRAASLPHPGRRAHPNQKENR